MKLKTLALAMTASVVSFSAAAETAYDQLITNTATLNYNVSGGTTVTATPATAEFKVDRLVKFNLSSTVSTSPAPVGESTAIDFTLTNNSNAPLDYSLPAITDVVFYNDIDGDGVWDDNEKGDGNKITGVISLVQDDGTPAFTGHVKKFLAVYTPLQGVDGDTQALTITATAVENDADLGTVGSTIVPTLASETWNSAAVQTVAETDGDGNFITSQSKTITYTFEGANIDLQKAVVVVSDPISRGESGAVPAGYVAKAIPGAILKYTITVTNSGSKAATLTLGDTMPSIFAVGDIDASSYKQSIDGAAEAALTGVTTGTNVDGDVTIAFPSVTANANNGTIDGTVVTTFEVTLP